jgi:uncharacterized membrane protein
MSSTPPPHYTAFRLVLVAVVLAVLALAVWVVLDPPVRAALLEFLGLG